MSTEVLAAVGPAPPADRRPEPVTVLLAPFIDLHGGYHGSLRVDPPPAVAVHARGGQHVFSFPVGSDVGAGDRLAPFDHPHLGELVDFGPGPQLVHSPRWPVLRRRAWVVDLDDFGYPALLGRHVFAPCFQNAADDPWTEAERRVASQRLANLLTAFAHPSCRAVLFWTQCAFDQAVALAQRYSDNHLADPVWAKSRVVYPAQRPLRRSLVRHKWQLGEPFRVVFVGNDFAVKQGALALDLFHRLAQRFPNVRFTYVGALPPQAEARSGTVELLGEIPRRRLLALLTASHLLFHPSRSESFGMVLLEAAAHGMAILTAGGGGMEHLGEVFRPGEAAIVVRRPGMGAEEEAAAFEAGLTSLLAAPERAAELALAAHRRVYDGPFHADTRNQTLQEIWRTASAEATDAPLVPGDLPHWRPGAELRLSSQALAEALRDYTVQNDVERRNFYVRPW
jgi:glycosyltransferase involved in cell wall biosynthesis